MEHYHIFNLGMVVEKPKSVAAEVSVFADPFIIRQRNRSERIKSASMDNVSVKVKTKSRKRGREQSLDNKLSIFDRDKLIGTVFESTPLDEGIGSLSKKFMENYKKEKMAKLGCDVSEKTYVNYKLLKQQRKGKKTKKDKPRDTLKVNNPQMGKFRSGVLHLSKKEVNS
eukprot:snap_masked-scaffold_9-processed-gene-4.25-mRNA-1 protein AED:1.00 eAED:1.00 QI:0/-1/0/0/-1/1/1/0/168